MFHKVPNDLLNDITKQMFVKKLDKNEVFIKQNEPTESFYLIESGNIQRKHVNPNDGRSHNVEFAIKAQSIDSMRVISGEKSFSTVRCISDGGCTLYEMPRTSFLNLINKDKPKLSQYMLEGLCEQLRVGSKKYVTPLLDQRGIPTPNYTDNSVNLPAVSIAAGIESYYRSALNSILNSRLTGIKGEYFPNMHIQVPTRIAYIAGFKGLRSKLDTYVDQDDGTYKYPQTVGLFKAILPGIIMTPIASILEASNAGHMNNESMATRWIRGIVPRCGREIIFGIGLNQLSDYFEERVLGMYIGSNVGPNNNQDTDATSTNTSTMDDDNTSDNPNHPLIANAAGSLIAGVISGYFSHIPHNLSTLKLLEPTKSYGELYKVFVNKSVPTIFANYISGLQLSSNSKSILRTIFATLFPRGLIVRTTQIVGSFIILNGTINYLHLREHYKIQLAVSGGTGAASGGSNNKKVTLQPTPPTSTTASSP